MKVWAKTEDFSEGKFLVTRRDGTTPDWPHFVMGACDPAVPSALIAYADAADELGFDPAFTTSVRELASDYTTYREQNGAGDPDAPPHRTDNPTVIAMMRHELSAADLVAECERYRHALLKIAEGGSEYGGPYVAAARTALNRSQLYNSQTERQRT